MEAYANQVSGMLLPQHRAGAAVPVLGVCVGAAYIQNTSPSTPIGCVSRFIFKVDVILQPYIRMFIEPERHVEDTFINVVCFCLSSHSLRLLPVTVHSLCTNYNRRLFPCASHVLKLFWGRGIFYFIKISLELLLYLGNVRTNQRKTPFAKRPSRTGSFIRFHASIYWPSSFLLLIPSFI